MMQILKKPQEQLSYKVYKIGDYGISPEDFERLRKLTDESVVDYEIVTKGDTNESGYADVYRLIHPKSSLIQNQPCLDILFSKSFMDFLSRETDCHFFTFDRIQTHIYREGGFLGVHSDRNEVNNYLYTLVLILNAAEAGGEFSIEVDGKFIDLDLKTGELLLLDASLPHKVNFVTKGERRSLCTFMLDTRSN